MFEQNSNSGEMNTAAITIHELFESYMRAGFTREEAFELCKLTLVASSQQAR